MRISSIFSMGIDDPPTDAECDSMSATPEIHARCKRLQDPAVWAHTREPADVPDILK